MVADFIKDDCQTWWCTGVKAFKIENLQTVPKFIHFLGMEEEYHSESKVNSNQSSPTRNYGDEK